MWQKCKVRSINTRTEFVQLILVSRSFQKQRYYVVTTFIDIWVVARTSQLCEMWLRCWLELRKWSYTFKQRPFQIMSKSARKAVAGTVQRLYSLNKIPVIAFLTDLLISLRGRCLMRNSIFLILTDTKIMLQRILSCYQGTCSWKILQKCYYNTLAINISCYQELSMLSELVFLKYVTLW